MSDKAYENALKRKLELQKELEKIDGFLRLYEQFAEDQAEYQPELPKARADSKGSVADAYVNPSRDEVGAYARELMIRTGQPKTRGEILAYLEEIGHPLKGKNPSQNIGTIMWRLRDQFRNIEGQGYWPSDVESPKKMTLNLDKARADLEALMK